MKRQESLIRKGSAVGQSVSLENRVIYADCLEVIPRISPASVDFIYIDPPYFTNRKFHGSALQDGSAPVDLSFNDRWQGGHQHYLDFLDTRVRLMRPLLKDQGVLLLHLDWHIVHYAKVMLDQIFGADAMVNELIWYYQTGGASRRRFSRKHDNILIYARGLRHFFDASSVAMPRSAKALYRARWKKGARISARSTHKIQDDVISIPALNPMARERNGFPTQKPLALLEFLIKALCPADGIVADFFCGSGTTLVAAQRLGRRFVGCDLSAQAVKLAQMRLAAR